MSAMLVRPEGRPDPRTSPSDLAPVPSPPDLEGLSPDERQAALREHGVALDLWKVQVATLTELGKAAGETTRLAVSQLLLVNAGAAVALVALLGNVAGRGHSALEPLVPELGGALLSYATGAILAVLVSVCAVLSHDAALSMRPDGANRWRIAAQVLFGMSLAAFGTGTGIAAAALLGMHL